MLDVYVQKLGLILRFWDPTFPPLQRIRVKFGRFLHAKLHFHLHNLSPMWDENLKIAQRVMEIWALAWDILLVKNKKDNKLFPLSIVRTPSLTKLGVVIGFP